MRKRIWLLIGNLLVLASVFGPLQFQAFYQSTTFALKKYHLTTTSTMPFPREKNDSTTLISEWQASDLGVRSRASQEMYISELKKLTSRVRNEEARYQKRVDQLCAAGVVTCSLSEGQNSRPQVIINPPCCRANLDPLGWRVSGAGTGAILDDSKILAGHLILNSSLIQTVPTYTDLVPCHVDKKCTFTIQSHDVYGHISKEAGADFRVRLVGNTMITGEVEDLQNGTYSASYIPREPGFYIIEVFLGIVEGEGSNEADGFPISNPFIVDATVFRAQHLLEVPPTQTNRSVAGAMCTSAGLSGRWVYMEHGMCELPFCEASDSLENLQISDPLGLNLNWVWVPWDCHYRLYTPRELEMCASRCRIHRFTVQGDSLAREQLQNIMMLLTSFNPSTEVPKLQLDRWSHSINGSRLMLEWSGDDFSSLPTDRFGFSLCKL